MTATKDGSTRSKTASCTSYITTLVSLFVYDVYGVSIDLTESDPYDAVTYTDKAVDMYPGGNSWDETPIFSGIKPCYMIKGAVSAYLDPDDFRYTVGGSEIYYSKYDYDTAGSNYFGDIMVEIPKLGFKISTSGNTVTVQVTDSPDAGGDGFHYYAHTRSQEGDCDHLYIGAYEGINCNGYLMSTTSRSGNGTVGDCLASGESLRTYRSMAQGKGTGYDVMSFYPFVLLQCLYLLRYKELNCQSAIARGCVDRTASDDTDMGAGYTIDTEMYGSHYTEGVKFAGIEGLWGNVGELLEGLYLSGTTVKTAFTNFNNNGSGYTSRGQLSASYGYMSKPAGTTELGFLPRETNGSSTTYFCDGAEVDSSVGAIPSVGGHFGSTTSAGIFFVRFNYNPTDTTTKKNGARLMYLKAGQ